MQCNAVLVCFLAVTLAAARTLQSDSERPVMKIVRLLQDMKAQLEKERADDEAVYKELDCWCEKNEDEKTKAIELGQAKIADLEAEMGEFAAKIEELREGLATTKEKLRQDQKALDTATEIRMKEVKEFQGEETDLIASIQSCQQAIVVLSKHHPSFTQLRTAAKNLEALKTMQLAKDTLGRDQMAVLKAFLQEAQSASLRRIPGMQSYSPQSGQIFGILKQMQEEFESNLSQAQKEEMKAKEDFNALKAAKEAEIAAGRKQQAQLEQDDAEFREKNEEAYQEFLDTQEQVKIDQTFLRNLKKKCAETDAEFEKRMKGRLEEIKAVEDTIAFLNSDGAFANFEKTVNTAFVQVSSRRSRSKTLESRRHRAAEVLRNAAGNGQFAALAVTVELDGFEKAIAAIDKMVVDLMKQQAEEVQHKDWCQEELQNNAQETQANEDKKASLQASISDLKKTIEKLTKEIEANKKAIAEMQVEMKRASEVREAENADFQETVNDQRITQVILQKAIARMSQVFALLQQQPGAPHIQTSGTHTDPGNGPARFTKYEQNSGGKQVIAMLEEVMADSKSMENEAITAEMNAQGGYEMFMKDSNKAINQALKANINMAENRAKAEEELSRDETDLDGTMKTLENLNDELGDLKKSCDFVLNNFAARQQARALEMDALREAKAILSGSGLQDSMAQKAEAKADASAATKVADHEAEEKAYREAPGAVLTR
jgi:DNA repair exonuclease SbcCD ATPase subunit